MLKRGLHWPRPRVRTCKTAESLLNFWRRTYANYFLAREKKSPINPGTFFFVKPSTICNFFAATTVNIQVEVVAANRFHDDTILSILESSTVAFKLIGPKKALIFGNAAACLHGDRGFDFQPILLSRARRVGS